MGSTGFFIVASSVIFFIGLVMICLKAPQLRMLKEDYGESYQNNFVPQQLHSGSLTDDPEGQIPVGNLGTLPDAEDEDGATLRAANTSMVMSMSQDDSAEDPPTGSMVQYPGSESFQADLAEDFSAFPLRRTVSDESDENMMFDDSFVNMTILSSKAAQVSREEVPDPPADAELHALAAKVADEPDEQLNSLAAKVAPQDTSNLVEQESDDLIDKCVTELQESFMN